MISHKDLESGFENDRIAYSGPIDFSSAQRIDRSGTTCDVYVTRYQRRRVFIKRLKKEFRENTVYLAALDKEFELGVNLSHPSLPEYREFHDDYIIMDYIDGVTVAEVLRGSHQATEATRWLRNPANLRRMLRELINVTGYLHRHNIVHSDIKADNIILADGTYNLILVDLDKAYTSWLDDTRGAGSLYGVVDARKNSTDIDFHGIGRLIDNLTTAGFPTAGFSKLHDKCFSGGVTADELLMIIDSRRKLPRLLFRVTIIVLITVSGFLWLTTRKESNRQTTFPDSETESDFIIDNEATDSTLAAIPTDTVILTSPAPHKVDPDALVANALRPLYKSLEILEQIAADSITCNDVIMDSLRSYADQENVSLAKAYRSINEARHNENFTDGMKEVWHTRSYLTYRPYADSIMRRVSDIWKSQLDDKKSRP